MKLTSDGEYQISELFPESANASVLAVYGSGAGSGQLTYVDDSGQDINIEDGDITPGVQKEVRCGYGANLFIQVSGASSAAPFDLEVRKIQ